MGAIIWAGRIAVAAFAVAAFVFAAVPAHAEGTPLPGMKQFGMIAAGLGVVLAAAGFFMSGSARFL